jgi:hypothetical protein
MAGNNKKGILSGPGIPGQQTSKAMRSVSNPPGGGNSPAVVRSAKAGPSLVSNQPEIEADQTLRTEEETVTPIRDKPVDNQITRSPLCSPRSPVLDARQNRLS